MPSSVDSIEPDKDYLLLVSSNYYIIIGAIIV